MNRELKKRTIIKLLANAIKIKRIASSIELITGAFELSAAFNLIMPIVRLMGLNLSDKKEQLRVENTEVWPVFLNYCDAEMPYNRTAQLLYPEIEKLICKHMENDNEYLKAISKAIEEFLKEDCNCSSQAFDQFTEKYKAANALFAEAKTQLQTEEE